MWRVIFSTYRKNRISIMRAVPWSFMVSRVITGITQIVFPYFIYHYCVQGKVTIEFETYTGGADYITYIVLGAALNVLAVSTLMNIGRALMSELWEGTLEPLLLSPAPRSIYFIGCLSEQTMRALLEFGTVMVVGLFLGADLKYFLSFQSLVVIVLSILSFFCVGITLSSLMLYTRNTYLTQNTLFVTMSLICGIVFPIEYLPEWVQKAALMFPLTQTVILFRNVVIQGEGIFENYLLVIQIIFLSSIYLVIGTIWYKLLERKLLESIFG